MTNILFKRLTWPIATLPIFICDFAYADCTLDPLTFSSAENVIIGGEAITAEVTNTFLFNRQTSGRVKIEHKIGITTPVANLQRNVWRDLKPLPDDECGQVAKYDGVAVHAEPPKLTMQINFSAAKWVCTSTDVPCSTLDNLGRTCRVQWKERAGTGNGYVKIYLTPSVGAEELTFTKTESRDFNLSDETRFLGSLLGFVTAGPAGIAVFNSFGDGIENEVKQQITVPPFAGGVNFKEIPGYYPKIESSGFSDDMINECHVIVPEVNIGPVLIPATSVCFPQFGVTLQLNRAGDVKAPVACFLHERLAASAP